MSKRLSLRYWAGQTACPWHRPYSESGRLYGHEQMFADGICPYLFHATYPYFLGALFGARYTYNDEGDCHVCCPADKGVDVLVRRRANDGSFGDDISQDMEFVIFADVVKADVNCCCGHVAGDRFIFPTCRKQGMVCPAGVHNVFPFLELPKFACINPRHLRCPDWLENVRYSIDPRDLDEDG